MKQHAVSLFLSKYATTPFLELQNFEITITCEGSEKPYLKKDPRRKTWELQEKSSESH